MTPNDTDDEPLFSEAFWESVMTAAAAELARRDKLPRPYKGIDLATEGVIIPDESDNLLPPAPKRGGGL